MHIMSNVSEAEAMVVQKARQWFRHKTPENLRQIDYACRDLVRAEKREQEETTEIEDFRCNA